MTTPNFSQPAIFSEISTPTDPDSGYLKVYAKSGALCSIANGGSEKAYATSTDLSSYLPLVGGTLTGDLLFTDATFDIGKSGATRPRDGFFSRDLTASGYVVGLSGISWTSSYSHARLSSAGMDNVQMYLNGTAYHDFRYGIHTCNIIGLNEGSLANPTNACLTSGPSAGVLDIRGVGWPTSNSATTAQTLRLFNTYTSTTSFENLQFKANAGAAYQIGSAIGSAGGTNRAIDFGHWNAAGTFSSQLSLLTTGVLYSTNAASTAVLQTAGGVVVYGSFIGTPHLSINGWSSLTQNFNGGLNLGRDMQVVFGPLTANAPSGGTSGDTGFKRNAAGVLEINNGTAGTYRDLILRDLTSTGAITLTQSVSTSGSPTALTLTAASHTTLTASTEATDVNFNLARTVQFAAGAISTQRAMRIQAPTYSFVGPSTITTASTLSISGPPTAGTNATITNKYALSVENNGILQLQNVSGYEVGVPRFVISLGSPYVGLGYVSFQVDGDGRCYSYAGFDVATTSSIGIQTHRVTFQGGWGDILRGSTLLNGNGVHYSSAYHIGLIPSAGYGVQVINGTNSNKLQIYNTYTSSTSYETINIKGKAGANFEIGPESGSAGGTLRGLSIGGYSAGSSTITPWLTFDNAGNITTAASGSPVTSNQFYSYYTRFTSNGGSLTSVSVGNSNSNIRWHMWAAGGSGHLGTTGGEFGIGYSTESSTAATTQALKFSTSGAATFAGNVNIAGTTDVTGNVTTNGLFSSDRYGVSANYRFRRANGTSGSPTQVTSGQAVGALSSFGWHDGGAFHSSAGAIMYFVAAEDYASGAQGTNIQFWTTPTLSTTSAKRVCIEASGEVTLSAGSHLQTSGAGFKIGTATSQKIGFWNATPVVQQVLATGAGATVDDVIALLQTLGLCKQS